MTEEELKKAREYFHSLINLQHVLENHAEASGVIKSATGELVQDEFNRMNTDFPDLIPSLDITKYHPRNRSDVYFTEGILSSIALARGRLKVAIDTSDNTPVTQTREFSFVVDNKLREVIERDYIEIQKAFIAECWKSVIILSGGVIEAILLHLLLSNETAAKKSPEAPKKNDITKWDLADLINVCIDIELIESGVEKLSHPVREYRNLVHPGNEITNKLSFGKEEATIAIEVLHMLHRDLSH